jgi:hypothetical protein
MLIRFDMSQEDVDLGVREDCENCPAARCIIRTLGLVDVVPVVTTGDVRFWPRFGNQHRVAKVDAPDNLGDFVIDLDTGEDVRPISFDLDIPDEVLHYAMLPQV